MPAAAKPKIAMRSVHRKPLFSHSGIVSFSTLQRTSTISTRHVAVSVAQLAIAANE
jgi:hypothetical protein